MWIYKHTIWKSASDIEYKENWPGAKSGFESIESRYYNLNYLPPFLWETWKHLHDRDDKRCEEVFSGPSPRLGNWLPVAQGNSKRICTKTKQKYNDYILYK